jgi:hypothetical protein
MADPKEQNPYRTGFCGGYSSPPNHKLCPQVIRNGEKSWTCLCDCHEEKP